MVESTFNKVNGFKYDAKVLYGDTDSIMIDFGKEVSFEEVMKLGKQAAAEITSGFIRPISLEFEKCYFPFLLINKKRYAGLLWTRLEKPDKMDTKGIEVCSICF